MSGYRVKTTSTSFRTAVPKISELYQHVIKKLAYRWEDLAIHLALDEDGSKIQSIRRDFFHSGVDICCMQALHHWLREEGKLPVNWGTILSCLEDMKCTPIALEIEEVLNGKEKVKAVLDETDCKLVEPSFEIPPLPANRYDLLPAVTEELHEYQWELAVPGLSGQNYIVCAPTGSGKTRVAGLVISEHLKRQKDQGKVLFVVNKVPLVQQQKCALEDMIQGIKIKEVTGDVAMYKKAEFSFTLNESSSDEENSTKKFNLSNADVIVCTAGCLLNEMIKGKVSLSGISLIVIDECHNTHKKTNYAKIMEIYIKEKIAGNDKLPQVMGLTATPGAGDASRPTVDSVLDHMITLCAAMDARGGIKTVTKHICELKTHQKSAVNRSAILEGRDEEEPLIMYITEVISILHKTYFKKRCLLDSKWSFKYMGWVNTKIYQYQEKANSRDKISVLKTIRCLSNALAVYHDLCLEDALAVLDEFSLPPSENATPIERNLSKVINQLKIKLCSLERVENPLLLQLESILAEQFMEIPKSKAIIFVETKKQATSIHQWITSRTKLESILPDVVTGQARDTGRKMTKAEQNQALEGFRNTDYNLLVSTSVLEEGIDVPACNLVIKYQKVTSEIAQVQTKGRARANCSQIFSIMSSNSGKQYQELLNEEKISLVEHVLKILPTGEALRHSLEKKQEEMLNMAKIEALSAEISKHRYSALEVDIHCVHCSTFLCNGSQIHNIQGARHYVVTDEKFVDRVCIKPHHNPSTNHRLARTEKLYCEECKQDLGVMGKWWKDSEPHPVLKCSGIKFIVNGEVIPCKKWKDAPFNVTPI